MRIGVYAVGRMKSGPERELADRYFDRFAKLGAGLGLDFAGVDELPESRHASADLRKRDEAERLLARMPAGAALIILDERGRNLSSDNFSARLASLRDSGTRDAALIIGGPDGHDSTIRDRAALVLSFGAQTWPHQMVRFMLAEQLYRAATILAGHPYHRE
ncbi:MAG: 23S rRNA (pseudouridine(1915)-N(3))-methyltransferase RlmH [Rhizobiaceae bacterium]